MASLTKELCVKHSHKSFPARVLCYANLNESYQ